MIDPISPTHESANRADLTRRAIRIAKAAVRMVRATRVIEADRIVRRMITKDAIDEQTQATAEFRAEVDALGPEGLDEL